MASNQKVIRIDPCRPGNDFFVQKEYEKALEAYSTAIGNYPHLTALYWNRAYTYLKLDRPFHALIDIETGLKLNPDHIKLIHHKGKALLALRRFSDAGHFLCESARRLENWKKDKIFKSLVKDMIRLKMEYGRGQYDLPTMIEESKKSMFLENHADYYAWSKFEIREVAEKGRSMVAKKKIKAGELLIACKAYVFVESKTVDLPSMNLLHGAMTEKERKILMDRPDLAEELNRLSGRSTSKFVDKWMVGGESKSFGGLWLIPSYINHSCVDANCNRYVVGDYMFIRATKSIEKGEEILISYIWPTKSFQKRQRVCRDTSAFECQCRLCVVERQDSIELKRRAEEISEFIEDLIVRLRECKHIPRLEITITKNLVDELWTARPQREVNYLAIRAQYTYARLIFGENKDESFRLLTEYFEFLKSNGDFELALRASKRLFYCSQFKGHEEQEKWKKTAREIAKLIYGDERMAI